MDAQDLQQIVELCDDALKDMKEYDRSGGAQNETPGLKLNNIIRTLLDDRNLTSEIRKLIQVKDQGPLATAVLNLHFSSWRTGQLYQQHSGKVLAVRNILQSNIDRLNARTTTIPHMIFYSWQSDLDSRFNRNFIEEALGKSVKNVARDGEVQLRIEQGAQGTVGSQSLHATILRKIETCGIFVADVSLVGGQGKGHCNSNVMYELGYATHCLGEERVLLICNTAYGKIEHLPFDIKHKHVIAYKLGPDDEKAPVRNTLTFAIENKIRPLFTK
ncbi:hypothetical protein [Luteimonas sp. SDU101]|uniref:hypothetical protein n=1 Tax=Luteimonas sp. SDU101 TaxID=3422593 RepID=UPI003EBA6581